MTGRREQRRQRTLSAVVEAADRLFHDPGYEAATVERIAAEAGVSPGTVYNYFGTKNAILTAVVTRESEEAIAAASTALDLDAGNVVDALIPVIDVYIDVVLGLGRGALKALFRTAFDSGDTRAAEEMWSLDERAVAQIEQALSRLQEFGLVAPDVSIAEAAVVVYSLVTSAVIVFMAVPTATATEAKVMIRSQLTIVATGLTPH